MTRRTPFPGAVACAIAATAIAALAQTAAAPAPLEAEKHLPAGKTMAFVSIADLATAEAAFATTDLGHVWKLIEPFRAELERGLDVSMADLKAEFEKEAGVKLDDALRALRGGVAAALIDVAPPDRGEPAPAVVLALSRDHRAVVEAMFRKAFPPEEVPPEQAPFKLVERGNALLVVQAEAEQALAGPGSKTLADDPGYRRMRERLAGPGVTQFLLAYGSLDGLWARMLASDPPAADRLAKAGALDVKTVGLSIGFADGRLRETIVALAPGERHGFAKALSAAEPLDVAALARQAPADLVSFQALRLDARATLDQTIEVVRTLDPGTAGEIENELARLERDLELRIREDLLGALGDTIVVEGFIPEDGLLPESVIVLAPRDPAKLEASLARLAQLGGLEVRTVRRGGRPIKYFQAPLGKIGQDPTRARGEEALQFAMALTFAAGAYFIDGDGVPGQAKMYLSATPQALEDRVPRLARGSLAQKPEFQAALAKAPQGARTFAWGEMRPFVGPVYHLALRLLRMFEPFIRGAGVPVDTALLPRPTSVARSMRPMTSAFVADADGFMLVGQGGVPVLSFVPVIAALGIPAIIESRGRAELAQAHAMLRMLHQAQMGYQIQKGSFAASIDDLVRAGMVGHPTLPGYEFVVSEAGPQSFLLEARPLDPRRPHLIVDESGYVRGFGEPNPFAPEPPPVEEGEDGGEPPDMPPPPDAPPGEGEDEGEGERNERG